MPNIIALNSKANTQTFMQALKDFPDPRDNRGKTLNLIFVIVSVVMAILSGRSTVSGISRYAENHCQRRQAITGFSEAKAASRAQLPRLLDRLNWQILNQWIERFFNTQIIRTQSEEWTSIDGKV